MSDIIISIYNVLRIYAYSDGVGDIIYKDAGNYMRYEERHYIPCALGTVLNPPHNGACGYLCVGAAMNFDEDGLQTMFERLIAAIEGAVFSL